MSTENTQAVTPYGTAARLYWSAGWGNPLPVGRIGGGPAKAPLPAGFTGREGKSVSWPDLNAWTSGREASLNIGIRATGGWVGIDVDSYGGKWGIETIEKIEAELGVALPPTFYSTSRGPGGRSGIRFFRVPAGWDASNLERAIRERFGQMRAGRPESDVEIIWHGWRHALVWPSVHPETGETYRLYGPDHQALNDVPRMDAAPFLPEAWRALGEAETVRPVSGAPSGAGDPFGQPGSVKRTAKTPEQAEALFAEKLAVFEQATVENSHRTDKLVAAALMGGHGVPNFWTAEQALARVTLAAEQNGFSASKGARYVEDQATKGIRDGYASEQWDRVEVFAPATPRESLRSKMITLSQLREMPPAVPLIEGVLDLNTTSWLIGVKKEYKSFVAIDWAGHVATGQMWRGRKVTQGKVLYIAAEGAQGLSKRVRAWESVYGQIPEENFMILPLPVQAKPERQGQVLGSEWLELIEIAREDRQALIIVDTQARCTVGMEENSNTEMNVWGHAVESLKAASGACVLPVHHMGHNGDQARGASGLGGLMDAGWKAQKVGKKAGEGTGLRKLKLSCLDMKDDDDSASMEIEMIHVEVPGTPSGSLVLKPYNPFAQPQAKALPSHVENMAQNKQHVIEVMREHSDSDGSAPSRIHTWIKERFNYDMPKSTLDSTLKALCEGGLVEKPSRAIYVLTEHLS